MPDITWFYLFGYLSYSQSGSIRLGAQVNSMMEAVVNKIRRQLVELATDGASAVGSLTVDG